MREKKRVSFSSTQTLFFAGHFLSSGERKKLCWYTNEDLIHCRNEAKEALRVLKEVDGNIDAVSGGICLRGIEKYADAVGKFRSQRMFVESVLQQQVSNRQNATKSGEENLATLSRYMSQPSREIALFYAARSIQQQIQDETERKQQGIPSSPPQPLSSSSSSSCSSWVSEESSSTSSSSHFATSNKRSRSSCFDEMSSRRRKLETV